VTDPATYREWSKVPDDLMRLPEVANLCHVTVREINRACDANRIQRFFAGDDTTGCPVPMVSLQTVKEHFSESKKVQ